MASVAVVMPLYKGERYLRAALDSVFAQSRQPDEVICIDDGSPDSSAHIAASYPGVTLHRQANAGVSAARNRGIALATTEWIAFLDQDDVWSPKKLELQLQTIAAHPACDVCVCNLEGLAEASAKPGPPSQIPPSEAIVPELFRSLRFPPSAVLARTSALLRTGGFVPSATPCEDWDLWLRLAASGSQFVRTPDLLLSMRAHENNVSNQSFRMMEGELRAWDLHIGPRFSPGMRRLQRLAAQSHFLGRVALMEREQHRAHLGIMTRSLLLSPWSDWHRYPVFAHMLLTRMGLLHPEAA